MRLRRFITVVALATLFSCLAAYAAGGTAGDPIATLSYIESVFKPQVLESARTKAAAALPSLTQKLSAFDAVNPSRAATSHEALEARIMYEAQMQYLDAGNYFLAASPTTLTLQAGERLRVSIGSAFTVTSGRAMLDGARAAEIIDTTAGEAHYAGMTAQLGHMYALTSDDIAGLYAASATVVTVSGSYQIIPPHQNRHTDDALYLVENGLMRGSNLGLELDRAATRLEAIIMFLRLIGEEQQALSFSGVHPFADVPKWPGDMADKYIAYAYAKGYTQGVAAARFGSTDAVTAEQYITFVLRALGYRDDADFVWLTALRDAERFGIITAHDRRAIDRAGFYRDDLAHVSKLALDFRN